MNERAKQLGMVNTHFENCTGAHHNDHVSTLTDIGILMAFIMQNDELAEIFGTYQYTTTPTVAHPEGLILTSTVYSRMEGSESGVCTVLGGKTGYTAQGGQCLATYAERTDSRTEQALSVSPQAVKQNGALYTTRSIFISSIPETICRQNRLPPLPRPNNAVNTYVDSIALSDHSMTCYKE